MLIEIAVCVWLLNLETAPGILSSEHSIALQCYSSLFIFSPSLLHIWLSFKSTFTGTTENCSRDAMRKSMLPPPQLKEGKGFRWQPTTWSPSFTWEWSEIKGCKSLCMHPTADRVSFHLAMIIRNLEMGPHHLLHPFVEPFDLACNSTATSYFDENMCYSYPLKTIVGSEREKSVAAGNIIHTKKFSQIINFPRRNWAPKKDKQGVVQCCKICFVAVEAL